MHIMWRRSFENILLMACPAHQPGPVGTESASFNSKMQDQTHPSSHLEGCAS